MGTRSQLCESDVRRLILMHMPVDINLTNHSYSSTNLMLCQYSRVNVNVWYTTDEDMKTTMTTC